MMAYAEYLAGIAFNNASLGFVHAMAHQLGGFYNLPHGVCNAILLPVVMEYNSTAVPELYIDIAQVMHHVFMSLSHQEYLAGGLVEIDDIDNVFDWTEFDWTE